MPAAGYHVVSASSISIKTPTPHIVGKEHRTHETTRFHGIRPAPMGNISSMARAYVASLIDPSDAKRPQLNGAGFLRCRTWQ